MQEKGLRVKSIHGDFEVLPARATDKPSEVGPVDLILFCVKTYHTDQAAKEILPAVGPQTAVLSLQNGIDAVDRLCTVVGRERLLGGATWLSSAVEAPGVINQVSQFHRIVFGELDGADSMRVQSISDVLNETGITVEVSDDIQKVLWSKFVFISAASSFGSLTRLPMGDYRSIPETREMITDLMKEVRVLANARGIDLREDVIQKSLDFMDNAAPHIKASMQLDVEAGRRTELEAMVGVIGREGRKFGIRTPTADFIYAALKPIDIQASAESPSPRP